GPGDERLEQAPLDALLRPRRVDVGDGRVEDLVLAVLAPRLRDALELGVGGLAPERPEVIARRAHLLHAEREDPLARETLELVVPESAEAHALDARRGARACARHAEVELARGLLDTDALHERVVEELGRGPLDLFARKAPEEIERARVRVARERAAEAIL